jgi:hypothetical protein
MEGATMSDLQRETLGSIARLVDQMGYAAMNGHIEVLKAQFDALKKQMAKLEIVREYV